MQAELSEIVRQAFEVGYDEFVDIVEKTSKLLSSENGILGNFEILGRLVKLKPQGHAVVVGDLHGDMESLVHILQETSLIDAMGRKRDQTIVFLGDYGDRGPCSIQVYYTTLKLKLLFPTQVILMRGNHEGPQDLLAHPHDLPFQLEASFGENGKTAYAKMRRLFECLYCAVLVNQRYLLIHGGLPAEARSLDDLAYAHTTHSETTFLEEMLWSDPDETANELSPSPRGAGKLFGVAVTERILNRFGVRVLIRGHEPCEEGFKINHNGRVLTLFSRKGSPYFNIHGAYLEVDFSDAVENAEDLIRKIHRF